MMATASARQNDSVNSDLVAQFCAITGEQVAVGERMLEACAWDLQMAIGMHMDAGGGAGSSVCGNPNNPVPSAGAITEASTTEDSVRAPIPQKQEVLVEEHNFGFRGRRQRPRSVFDGFRDFQREAWQQEAAMASSSQGLPQTQKQKTLEDLFRPPLDLMHKGSFQSARNTGTTCNKWLMVNIQDVKEFQCQALNRDLWSHSAVKSIVKESFIFWQVYRDSEEGRKYTQFYKVTQWPYIAIIDPRTGENMVVWNNVDAMSFCDLMTNFLCEHPCLDTSVNSEGSPPRKKRRQSEGVIDQTEDSQLEAAIQASLVENKVPIVPDISESEHSDSDDEDVDLETFTDSDDDTPNLSTKLKESVKKKSSSSAKVLSHQHSSKITKELPDNVTKHKHKTSSNNHHVQSSNVLNKIVHGSESFVLEPERKDTGKLQIIPGKDSGDISDIENGKGSASKTAKNIVSEESIKESTKGMWREHLGKEDDPKSNLIFRFPDGKKAQLSIACTSKLHALILYVVEQGYSNESYELVTNYPRRKLSYMELDDTLKQIGLFPQETIFVQER